MPPHALSATSSEIEFLLLCLDCVDGNVKWEEVALRSGRFKAGQYARQFYNRMKDRWRDKTPGLAVDPRNIMTSAKMDKGYKAGKKRVVADPDETESESEHEMRLKRQKKAGQKVPFFAGSKNEAVDNMLQPKALPSTDTKDKKVALVRPAATAAAPTEEEQAGDRAVERAASHSQEGSIFNGTYQGHVEPAEDFDTSEDEVKWEDWVNI
ncbi:hypothetical protein DV736_g1160, partial [Chaetothyriales sp. CBS 134916]